VGCTYSIFLQSDGFCARLSLCTLHTLGNDPAPWYIGYGVWLGVK